MAWNMVGGGQRIFEELMVVVFGKVLSWVGRPFPNDFVAGLGDRIRF